MPSHFSETTKHAVDAVAVGTTVATIMSWLPAAAALITIIWTSIRIWETDTVQILFNRKPLKKRKDE
jgi:hypothetical protein